MTRKELNIVLKVLEKIKNPDTYVTEAIYNVKKDLMRYDRRQGQLREMNEYDYPW
jgi:hypothetical protein